MVILTFYIPSRLRGGASYRYVDGITALYLDGQNGSYADIPSVGLFQFPEFSITFWVKVLEPAKTPGYIYADWSDPHQFAVKIHGEFKSVGFTLNNKLGQELLSIYSS